MRSYPLHEARAKLSRLFDGALKGEPQRVTRHGKDAVIIVSEAEWARRPEPYAHLGELLVDFAEKVGFREEDFERPWTQEDGLRPLGADFGDD